MLKRENSLAETLVFLGLMLVALMFLSWWLPALLWYVVFYFLGPPVF